MNLSCPLKWSIRPNALLHVVLSCTRVNKEAISTKTNLMTPLLPLPSTLRIHSFHIKHRPFCFHFLYL